MGGMLGLPEHHKDGVPWGLRKTGTRLSEEEVQELRDYMSPRSTTRSKAPGDKGKAPSGSSSPMSRPDEMPIFEASSMAWNRPDYTMPGAPLVMSEDPLAMLSLLQEEGYGGIPSRGPEYVLRGFPGIFPPVPRR